jgi:hypothetical protein
MDYGLTVQQKLILRRARVLGLPGALRWQVVPPLWLIALVSLAPLPLVWHPGRYLWLMLIPALGFWYRRRIEQRFQEWALDLRER